MKILIKPSLPPKMNSLKEMSDDILYTDSTYRYFKMSGKIYRIINNIVYLCDFEAWDSRDWACLKPIDETLTLTWGEK